MSQPSMQKLINQLVSALVALGIFLIANITQHPAQSVITEAGAITGEVTRIIDGDTLVVKKSDGEVTVRLLGIDAPETATSARSDGVAECFATEATSALSQRVPKGTMVQLQTDASQDTYDKYGRLLAYVMRGDENVNEWLIREGYVHEYTYQGNAYMYQKSFKSAQSEAKQSARGLWAPQACTEQ